MIYITGDIHADPRRFNMENFPEQKGLSREDYVIICGDFGLVWDQTESKRERWWLDWLEAKPYTTCFIDGNHENFTRLQTFPEEAWMGGKVHKIREHVIHLMRGECFCLNGKRVFAFGGARSHDIYGLADTADLAQDYTAGILHREDPLFDEKRKRIERMRGFYRVEEESWWRAEMPSEAEMLHGMETLRQCGGTVDVIVSHEGPASVILLREKELAVLDPLTQYLENIRNNTTYGQWFFGHHHLDCQVTQKDRMVYEEILRIDSMEKNHWSYR